MSLSNVYSVGLNNVGSYQVSGMPFASGSITATTSGVKIEFPFVTQWVQVIAHTSSASDDVRVGFSKIGVSGSGTNYFRLHASNNSNHESAYGPILPLKLTEIWVATDTGTVDIDIVAGLTNSPARS